MLLLTEACSPTESIPKHRVLHGTAESPRPEFQPPTDFPVNIDMGYAFGDACVKIDGYPLKLFPPSGIMQVVSYESINVEVLSRLANATKAKKGSPDVRKH